MFRIPATVDRPTDLIQNVRRTLNWFSGGFVILLVSLGSSYATAQAVVEYGNLSALSSSGASKAARATADASLPAAQPAQPGATAMPASQKKAGEVANRQALEAQAGKNAAKLMLRSVPSKAWVRINGNAVGRTPLLLVVAPGVYSIQMEGSAARSETARRQVDLLPDETREVVLTLQSPYPTHVRLSARSPK